MILKKEQESGALSWWLKKMIVSNNVKCKLIVNITPSSQIFQLINSFRSYIIIAASK
jgi:hypothetical protein